MSPALPGGFTAPPGKSLNVLLINEQADYIKQREKVTTPEVKGDFLVCTCAGRLLGDEKWRGLHPIISVDMHP